MIFNDLDFDAGRRVIDAVVAVADDGCAATTCRRCRRGFAVGFESLVAFDIRDLELKELFKFVIKIFLRIMIDVTNIWNFLFAITSSPSIII